MDSLKINREEKQLPSISDEELSEIITASDIDLPAVNNQYTPAALVDNMFEDNLSEIELNFCQRFIFSKDVYDAVAHSGYDITGKKNWELLKFGRKLLLQPSVQSFLKQLQAELIERSDIKKEDYIMWLNSIKLRAEASGLLAIELKAAEAVGKAQGLIAPKKVDYTNKVDISFGNFDPNLYSPLDKAEDSDFEEIE